MPPMPRLVIEAPANVKPRPFGLLQTVPGIPFTNPHAAQGVEYQRGACGHNVGYAAESCTSITATTGTGTPPNLPSTVTVHSDIVGTYTIVWGDGTANSTITITSGETSETTPNHNYATAGNKTITVTGPSGFGVQTVVVNAGTANTYTGTHAAKAALPGDGTVYGDPVTVVGRYDCRTVGMTLADQQSRAVEALNLSESWALERVFGERTLAPTGVDVTGGTATSIERALALLNNYAAVSYAGQPVLHLTAFAAEMAASKGLIERHGNHLETVTGSLVVVGAGYSVHPVGASNAIYVTGHVTIQQGAAETHQVHTMSPSPTNETTTIAERTSVITSECIVAKALVTTS